MDANDGDAYGRTAGGYRPPGTMDAGTMDAGPMDAGTVEEGATGQMAPVTGSRAEMMGSRAEMMEGGAVRPMARSAMVGMLISLVGAWGGAVAFFGPKIGLGRPGAAAWEWTTPHTVLNVIPGGAAFLGGLMVLFGSRLLAGRLQRLGSLLAFGAGAWFVLGSAVYPVFYGSGAPGYMQTGRGPLMNLASVAGYGLGVGIVLCTLAGLAMAWSAPRLMRRARAVAPAGMRRERREAALPLRNTEPVGI